MTVLLRSQTAELVYFITERDSKVKILEDKSLCISLSRKGEFPVKSIVSSIIIAFSAFS